MARMEKCELLKEMSRCSTPLTDVTCVILNNEGGDGSDELENEAK